jgi:small subunit ribosomal protein S19
MGKTKKQKMKRSKWKGLFTTPKTPKIKTLRTNMMPRNSTITPKLVDQTFQVHSGNKFKNVTISNEMLGHKFGEFVKTRAVFEYKKKKKKKKT